MVTPLCGAGNQMRKYKDGGRMRGVSSGFKRLCPRRRETW